MRVLIVAMGHSIHTARWINQISDQGWDIHLFPSIDYGKVHPDIENVTVHHTVYGAQINKKVKIKGFPLYYGPAVFIVNAVLKKIIPNYRVLQLKRLIRKLKPDVVHSQEIQHGAYLTLETKRKIKDKFPPWIVTNWGSDIYLFGRLSEHEPKIREVLASCDYYSCECKRDVGLAREYGFKGEVLPVFPNAGGFDIEFVSSLKRPAKVSERRLVMLKGNQSWAGRPLVGLRALERCAEILKGYEVAIYAASKDVIIAAELFTKSTGVPTRIIPCNTAHKEMLKLHGQARISIGLSISDAISTSLLEAMVMGSFPIQSWTACANEWVEDGVTGLIVPPDDPDVIEKAIRRTIIDDELVNSAAELNWQTVLERLDHNKLKAKVMDFYSIIKSNF